MNLDNFIFQVFHTNNYKLTKMNKGLTNHNYLLYVNNNTYVLRIPRHDSENIVDRKHEKEAISYVKDLNIDVENIYFDEQSGYKITLYHKNLYEFENCPFENKIERVAETMKKLHHKNKLISYDFEPVKKYEQYVSHIKHMIYPLKNYENILNEIKHLDSKKVFCHNDWVSGNILFSNEHTYLIDYEYGSNNNPLFDVMSFITENNITDESLRERFYKVYFDKDIPYHELSLWETFHNLLWCAWANMMYDSRNEEIYKTIAKEKYDALCTSYLHL